MSAPVFRDCSSRTCASVGCAGSPALLRREVDHLPPHHAARAGCRGERQHELRAHAGVGVRLAARKDLEGERKERVAGEDCRPLVERLVHRRHAAAHVVVVHARQIVVDERVAMDALEGGGGIERCGRGDIEQRRALDHEERAEALAARQQRVAHGRVQPRSFARAA